MPPKRSAIMHMRTWFESVNNTYRVAPNKPYTGPWIVIPIVWGRPTKLRWSIRFASLSRGVSIFKRLPSWFNSPIQPPAESSISCLATLPITCLACSRSGGWSRRLDGEPFWLNNAQWAYWFWTGVIMIKSAKFFIDLLNSGNCWLGAILTVVVFNPGR